MLSAKFLQRKYWPHLTWQKARDAYNKLLCFQNGGCAICGGGETEMHPKTGQPRPLSVDHIRDTFIVRGLLCNVHNRGLGYFQHDPKLLRAAADYVEQHQQEQKIAEVIPIPATSGIKIA